MKIDADEMIEDSEMLTDWMGRTVPVQVVENVGNILPDVMGNVA